MQSDYSFEESLKCSKNLLDLALVELAEISNIRPFR